jgi:hypothetical protein
VCDKSEILRPIPEESAQNRSYRMPTTRSHPPPSGNELIINPGGKAADVGWDFCDNLFAIFQTNTSVQKLNNKKRSVMPHGHTVEREKWLKT